MYHGTLVGASGQKSVPAGHQNCYISTGTYRSHTASSAINNRKVKQHKLSWSLCTLNQGCRWRMYYTPNGCSFAWLHWGSRQLIYTLVLLHYVTVVCVHVC